MGIPFAKSLRFLAAYLTSLTAQNVVQMRVIFPMLFDGCVVSQVTLVDSILIYSHSFFRSFPPPSLWRLYIPCNPTDDRREYHS